MNNKVGKGALVAMAVGSMLASGCAMKSYTSHAEQGKVRCMGVNSCQGRSACATATNSCAGSNSCQGQGWVEVTVDECLEFGGTHQSGS